MHAFLLLSLTTGCAADASSMDEPIDAGTPDVASAQQLDFKGSEAAFDVMTWNLEQFPKMGDGTIAKASEVIAMLAPDVVGVQEVVDADSLRRLADAMPGWEAIVAWESSANETQQNYNPPVGALFDTSAVTLNDHYLLYEGLTLPFPRSPLVLEITWREVPLVIVVVHLKALGDGVLDTTDPLDEEVRRRDACDLLDLYLREHLDDERVIVMGDFNDRIEEPRATNVFWSLLERPERYLFADMPLALEPTDTGLSYPNSGSHIDHILLTNELVVAYLRGTTIIRTAAVDRVLPGGWYEYETTLSDHRPVFLSLDLAPR
jgi:endonuclease/exonuclease/phosphatase family metal-dependent hydrolase